jgi:phosphatidate cytidylyltransferase
LDAPASKLASIRPRLFTGVALVAAFVLAIYLASPVLWLSFVLLIVGSGAWEWAGLLRFAPFSRILYTAMTLVAGVALVAYGQASEIRSYLPAVVFWVVLIPPWLARGWPLPPKWLGAAVGWVLLLSSLMAMVFLRGQSPSLVLATLGIAVVADSAAYFTGRAWGRHKLAPSISPGKTLEGALGGWAGVTVFALLLYFIWPNTCGLACLLRVIVSCWVLFVFSLLGDLYESWVKRLAGVKDSSQILPGHGGVLDRIDSHLAVLPAAALLWIAR